jgi:hypothetical protein
MGDHRVEMIKVEEYRPHFVVFERYLRAQISQPTESEDAQVHYGHFLSFLEKLDERVRWELPLVLQFSEAGQLGNDFESLKKEVEEGLAGPPQTWALLEAVEELHLLMEAIRRYQEHLPVFTDVEVLNEILLLAASAEDELKRLDPQSIQLRLPLALAWISDTESSWKLFASLHPEQMELARNGWHFLAGIKGALGGLHLALTQESEREEIVPACGVLVEALRALAECELARYRVEGAGKDSKLPISLLRGRRALLLDLFPLEAISEVHRYFFDRSKTLESLRLQGLCQELPDHLTQTVELRRHELLVLARDWRALSSKLPVAPSGISELLARCEAWEHQFQELRGPSSEKCLDASGYEEVLVS